MNSKWILLHLFITEAGAACASNPLDICSDRYGLKETDPRYTLKHKHFPDKINCSTIAKEFGTEKLKGVKHSVEKWASCMNTMISTCKMAKNAFQVCQSAIPEYKQYCDVEKQRCSQALKFQENQHMIAGTTPYFSPADKEILRKYLIPLSIGSILITVGLTITIQKICCNNIQCCLYNSVKNASPITNQLLPEGRNIIPVADTVKDSYPAKNDSTM